MAFDFRRNEQFLRDDACNFILLEFSVIEEFGFYGNVHVFFESIEVWDCKFADVLVVTVDGCGESVLSRNEDAIDFADLRVIDAAEFENVIVALFDALQVLILEQI